MSMIGHTRGMQIKINRRVEAYKRATEYLARQEYPHPKGGTVKPVTPAQLRDLRAYLTSDPQTGWQRVNTWYKNTVYKTVLKKLLIEERIALHERIRENRDTKRVLNSR